MQTDAAQLADQELALYQHDGHLTVPSVFSESQILAALEDADSWGAQVVRELDDDQRRWYLERQADDRPVLRKLDNPVAHRQVFRDLASSPTLVHMVEQLIGSGVFVFFSQIFFKPPEGGGPKPVHQDNFYFGPDDPDGMVTAWIALDEATTKNGCLYYGKGTNRGPVHPHVAPPDEPFNLQLPLSISTRQQMTPAPVPRGGVSFHHGNTFHQSSANTSTNWRRAAAVHYLRNDVKLVNPALPYDESVFVQIT